MLNIENLTVRVAGKTILDNLSLSIPDGEVHVIMGPNGAGKSSLAHVMSGKEDYEVVSGKIILDGVDILEMEPHERAAAGLFLAFQQPVEIPGVSYQVFMRHSVNAIRRAKGLQELNSAQFLKEMKTISSELGITNEMLSRGVNVGYSGGEKKRAEIMQLSLLKPKLAVLDETDSGLDVDALRVVSEGVNALRAPYRSFLIITHFSRLLDLIVPDKVHILKDGKVQISGSAALAKQIEANGYTSIGA